VLQKRSSDTYLGGGGIELNGGKRGKRVMRATRGVRVGGSKKLSGLGCETCSIESRKGRWGGGGRDNKVVVEKKRDYGTWVEKGSESGVWGGIKKGVCAEMAGSRERTAPEGKAHRTELARKKMTDALQRGKII